MALDRGRSKTAHLELQLQRLWTKRRLVVVGFWGSQILGQILSGPLLFGTLLRLQNAILVLAAPFCRHRRGEPKRKDHAQGHFQARPSAKSALAMKNVLLTRDLGRIRK